MARACDSDGVVDKIHFSAGDTTESLGVGMRRIRFFIPAALAAIAALFLFGGIRCGHEPPGIYSEGRNGIWLRHDWVGRRKTPGDYARLAKMLGELHVTDAYFHAGPLRADGSIDKKRHQPLTTGSPAASQELSPPARM